MKEGVAGLFEKGDKLPLGADRNGTARGTDTDCRTVI